MHSGIEINLCICIWKVTDLKLGRHTGNSNRSFVDFHSNSRYYWAALRIYYDLSIPKPFLFTSTNHRIVRWYVISDTNSFVQCNRISYKHKTCEQGIGSLMSWGWRQHIPANRWQLPTKRHGPTSKKKATSKFSAVSVSLLNKTLL
jgi:hypothetical protein